MRGRDSARLLRYAGAAIGPLSVAGSQFLLSLLLLRVLDLADFGRFAFLMVIAQLATSVWSALFTAPLLVAVADEGEGVRSPHALAAVSMMSLLPAGLVIGALALLLGTDARTAGWFGLWGALVLMRYFGRAWCLVGGKPWRTILSDILYGIILSFGGLLLGLRSGATLGHAALLLFCAAGIGLLPFLGRRRSSGVTISPALWFRDYRAIWQRDVRWSLVGVLTTEVTVNSQSYIVAAIAGASGFAPIAATALLIRPITVAVNALTEFERARFARDLREGALEAVKLAAAHLRLALLAIWTLTLILSASLLFLAPNLLFHDKFDIRTLWVGAVLWFLVVLARACHAPDGAILLARGRFRALAMLSSMTACVSLSANIVLVFVAGPIWSIGGIALGEGLFAVLLFTKARGELRIKEGQAIP